MLHAILWILKLIGIIILILLGLLLTAVLLVLLVPVRYRVKGSYYGTPKGRVKITWLLHIVSVTVSYEEQLSYIVRIFGLRFFKEKKTGAVKREEDLVVQAMEVPEESKDITADKGLTESELQLSESRLKEPQITEHPLSETDETGTSISNESDINTKNPKPTVKINNFGDRKKKNWFASLADRIKAGYRRILSKLKFSFRRICDTLKTVKDRKDQLKEVIKDEQNQKTVKLLLRQLKKLARHILPRRGKGTVTFGFEDPYLTGQALTWFSVIYPFCHKRIEIHPVFDSQIFSAEGYFKGRIRLGSLLASCGRMLLNKNFRTWVKRVLR